MLGDGSFDHFDVQSLGTHQQIQQRIAALLIRPRTQVFPIQPQHIERIIHIANAFAIEHELRRPTARTGPHRGRQTNGQAFTIDPNGPDLIILLDQHPPAIELFFQAIVRVGNQSLRFIAVDGIAQLRQNACAARCLVGVLIRGACCAGGIAFTGLRPHQGIVDLFRFGIRHRGCGFGAGLQGAAPPTIGKVHHTELAIGLFHVGLVLFVTAAGAVIQRHTIFDHNLILSRVKVERTNINDGRTYRTRRRHTAR